VGKTHTKALRKMKTRFVKRTEMGPMWLVWHSGVITITARGEIRDDWNFYDDEGF
jgi:hypothetical protein